MSQRWEMTARPQVILDLATARVAAPKQGSGKTTRTLQGILLHLTPGCVRMIATDKYRAACTLWPTDADTTWQALIGAEHVQTLLRSVRGQKDVVTLTAENDADGRSATFRALDVKGDALLSFPVQTDVDCDWLVELIEGGDLTPVHKCTFDLVRTADIALLCPKKSKGSKQRSLLFEVIDNQRLRISGNSEVTNVRWQYVVVAQNPRRKPIQTLASHG